MTTDTFEDELRSLLQNTADAEGPAYVDVDPTAVLASGRRVVRRRRIATVAAAAAAVLAIGVTGAVIGGVGPYRADTTVPATQQAGGPVTVDLARSADVGERWGRPDGLPGARVTVDRSTGKVEFLAHQDGTLLPIGTDQMPTAPRNATWATSDAVPGLVVGVLPAAAKDISFVWTGDAPAATHATARLPGTEYQAFAVWHEGGKGDTIFAGFNWSDGDRVYDSLGSPAQSARVGDVLVFVDRTHASFGIFSDGTIVSKELSVAPSGQVPVIMSGRQDEGSPTMASTTLLVLPAGARDVRLTPTAGATLDSLDVVPGGSTADTLVVSRLTMPGSVPGSGVDRVTWVNPDGSEGAGTPAK